MVRTCLRSGAGSFGGGGPGLLAIALTGLALTRAVGAGWTLLTTPGPVALENPAVAAVALVQAGEALYSRELALAPPFHIQMYPPLYPMLLALVPNWPGDPYRSLRLVSALFMVMAVGTLSLGVLSRRGLLPSLCLGAVLLSVYPFAATTVFARHDSLGLLLSALSVMVLYRWGARSSVVLLSAMFATLAVAAKQSFLAAPGAILIYLALTDRRAVLQFLAAGSLMGGGGLVFAHSMWGEEFWWSTVAILPVGVDVPAARDLLLVTLTQPTVTLLLIATLVLPRIERDHGGRIKPGDPRARGGLLVAYGVAASVLCLATLPKVGSQLNYFLEPLLALTLLIQHQTQSPRSVNARARARIALLLILLAGLLGDGFMNRARGTPFHGLPVEPTRVANTRALGHMGELFGASAAPSNARVGTVLVHPRVPNVTPHFGLHPVMSDPFLYAVLMEGDQLPDEIFIGALKEGKIDLVLLPADSGLDEHPGFGPGFMSLLLAEYEPVPFEPYRVFARPGIGGTSVTPDGVRDGAFLIAPGGLMVDHDPR
jgi:hypothetical protein